VTEQTLDDVVAAIVRGVETAESDALDDVLHAALAGLGPQLDVERAYLVAVDSDTGRVALANEWCTEGSDPALSTVLDMALSSEEEIRRKLAGLGVQSVLVVPAHPAGSLIGTIFVATSRVPYQPDTKVVSALASVLDAFMNRLVGVRSEQARLAMRDALSYPRRELPASET
jgi:hypothetical protein